MLKWLCVYSIDVRELRFSHSMVFAIEEINNSTELLPGIKLGYQIHDSCTSVPVAVHVAFQLSNGLDPVFYTSSNCSHSGMVMAIVGESGSTPSIAMSRIIGSFNIPLVSISNFQKTVCMTALSLRLKQWHFFFSVDEPLCHMCMSVW